MPPSPPTPFLAASTLTVGAHRTHASFFNGQLITVPMYVSSERGKSGETLLTRDNLKANKPAHHEGGAIYGCATCTRHPPLVPFPSPNGRFPQPL